jgi:hypothetical protein
VRLRVCALPRIGAVLACLTATDAHFDSPYCTHRSTGATLAFLAFLAFLEGWGAEDESLRFRVPCIRQDNRQFVESAHWRCTPHARTLLTMGASEDDESEEGSASL